MFREKFNYLIVQIKIIQKIDSLDYLENVNLGKVNLEKINSLEIGRVKKTKGTTLFSSFSRFSKTSSHIRDEVLRKQEKIGGKEWGIEKKVPFFCCRRDSVIAPY